jgi:ABC-2 type transport system permease protein
MSNNSPLLQLTLMRFREFVREPDHLFWVLAFPILLAAGLGLAFRNRPPEILKVVTVNAELARSLRHEKLLDVEELSPREAEAALRLGKAALLVEPGDGGTVVYRFDDTSAEGRTARMLADRAVQHSAGRVDPIASQDQPIVEPGARYIDFLIPGLLGMNMMSSAIWSVGYVIADTRRRKLMKRLVATPMRRHHYLLSFLISRLGLLILETGTILAFGALVFHVPLRGSWTDLAVICVLGSLSFTALGLLISSRARTVEAVSGLANLAMLPMWIASGVFFSAQRFPDLLMPLIKVLPLTAAIDALRANMLQGANLAHLGPELGVLAAWMLVCFTLAMWLFRWR